MDDTVEAESGKDNCAADDNCEADLDVCNRDPDHRYTGARTAMIAGVIGVIAVGSLTGWLGYRSYNAHRADDQRNHFIAAGRKVAQALTTISYTEIDSNLQRILESSTGSFHDDFQNRSKPFAEVVKQAQSTSQGTIEAAGLESQSGDLARVLVAVSVKTSLNGTPEPEPRRWRMRLDVVRQGGDFKVSDVQFVP
ncbi:mammalian cell entry protein [Mycobacterium vicinigordonae]|uniref:Mammalian cell entry protein n=1 Tax=Mycobacterium vicinigordonae TaxID=1719132 RepID=A0A7D6E535_9MYCO|nr:mammalian cell entry protein [Mycobacterium vicinigordonae]QLL07562.1 mammalian cell entry protein [Mycobacterium vicinigordonae]